MNRRPRRLFHPGRPLAWTLLGLVSCLGACAESPSSAVSPQPAQGNAVDAEDASSVLQQKSAGDEGGDRERDAEVAAPAEEQARSPPYYAADPITQLAQLELRLTNLGVILPHRDGAPLDRVHQDRREDENQGPARKKKRKSSRPKRQEVGGSASGRGGSSDHAPPPTTAPPGGGTSPGSAPGPSKDGSDLSFAEEDAAATVEGRCAAVCNVAEAICALESRICELAQAYPGGTEYADACERAADDCEVGSLACQRCSP